jgi:hypothetical protein
MSKKTYFTIPQCLASADRKIDKTLGYVRVYCPMHPYANTWGYVYEHRLVIEQSIGRTLIKGECVHHKNGVRWDNRLENLQLLSASEHSKIPKGIIGIDESNLQGPVLNLKKKKTYVKICQNCQTSYEAKRKSCKFCCKKCCDQYHDRKDRIPKIKKSKTPIVCQNCGKLFVKTKNKYCSVECAKNAVKKCNVSKEELIKLIWEKPITKIAEQYNVSDKCIHKQIKKYNLVTPSRGYWARKENQ